MDESTVSTYAGEVASLVAPRFRHEPVCVCREGFAGDKCEVMLNKCALQPCPTFKVCIPDTSAQEYSCHCPEGMAGPQCDIDIASCRRKKCSVINPLSFSTGTDSFAAYRFGHYGNFTLLAFLAKDHRFA